VPIIFKGSGFYVTDIAEEKKRREKRHDGDGQAHKDQVTESPKKDKGEKTA
jgi:predicted nucleic acid-binding Zn ribbon protein